jgi:hypothetical protein
MEMQKVKSSNISAIGYDPDDQVLHVEFNNGKSFEYQGVTPAAFDELQNAKSIGGFLHKNIKSNFKCLPL